MTPKQFEKFENRDLWCYHCGKLAPYLVPHHRSNRGMGGSKLKDRPSNIIAVCAVLNSEMESNANMAKMAEDYGWKLSQHANPLIRPVYDACTGTWWQLDDNFGRIKVRDPRI